MKTDTNKTDNSTLVPAASVIVIKEIDATPSVLLVHRSPELRFHADLWAFPGGHIDPEDTVPGDPLETARRCAIRETMEETGLLLGRDALAYSARWITPAEMPRRFDTWFFFAEAADQSVRVDGMEIVEHAWCAPRQALADHNRNIRRVTPPAFVFLSQLAAAPTHMPPLNNPEAAPHIFQGRLIDIPDGLCTLYQEDEAYQHGDLTQPGPRHRLWMRDSEWSYENRY